MLLKFNAQVQGTFCESQGLQARSDPVCLVNLSCPTSVEIRDSAQRDHPSHSSFHFCWPSLICPSKQQLKYIAGTLCSANVFHQSPFHLAIQIFQTWVSRWEFCKQEWVKVKTDFPPCSGAEQSVYLSKGAVSRVVIMKYEITNGALLGKQVHVETCSFYFQEAFFFSAIWVWQQSFFFSSTAAV